MKLSVIIPAYNEGGNIIPLYERLKEVLAKHNYEIIFVDDGSTDNTFDKMMGIKDEKVRCISFMRNFGKAAALSSGFDNSKGNVIITMDADLQDDPSEIPKLLEKLNEGYDLVVGWKYPRVDSLTKKIASKIFNFMVRRLTKIKLHDSDCNFRVMRREVVDNLNIYGGLFRYIPSLAHWKGFKITEVKVKHNKRFSGKTKYKGFRRLISGFLDLITIKFLISYRTSPIHLFGFIGLSFSFLGFVLGLYLLYEKYVTGLAIGNRPLLFLTLLLILVGIQFVLFGLLGELVTSNISKSSKNYFIKKKS